MKMKQVVAIWMRVDKDSEWEFWGFVPNGKEAKRELNFLKNQGREGHATPIEIPE